MSGVDGTGGRARTRVVERNKSSTYVKSRGRGKGLGKSCVRRHGKFSQHSVAASPSGIDVTGKSYGRI